MESEARLTIVEIGGKRKEQERLTRATRATNRVVQSPTYKMAPVCRASGQERTARKTHNLETETSGTGHSEEKKDETKIRAVEDETGRVIRERLHFEENGEL